MDTELQLAKRIDPVKYTNLMERVGQRRLPEVGGKYIVTGRMSQRACGQEDHTITIRSVDVETTVLNIFAIAYRCSCNVTGSMCKEDWQGWETLRRLS